MKRILNAPATIWIIVVNVIIFVLAMILTYVSPSFMDYIALTPSYILQGKYVWTILTSMFMHAGIFHLFANMYSLIFLGSFAERLIGKKRFLWIYLIAGIFGSIFYILFSPNSLTPAVGASGAIFGISGILAVLTPKMKVYILFIPVALPMWVGVIAIMVVLWLLSISAGLPIGNTAHLGGLLAGLAYAFYLRKKHPEKARMISNYFQ